MKLRTCASLVGLLTVLVSGTVQASSSSVSLSIPTEPDPFPGAIIVDVDADGLLDRVNGNAEWVYVHRNLDGVNYVTSSYRTVFTPQSSGGGAGPYAAQDLTGDAFPDLLCRGSTVSAGCSIETLFFMRNGGDGTFHDGQVLYSSVIPSTASSLDLNADGLPELFLTGSAIRCGYEPPALGSLAAVLHNRGDGTFGPAQQYPPDEQGMRNPIVFSDLNGDTLPDLVLGGFDLWLPNVSTSTSVLFGLPMPLHAGPGVLGLAAAALNADDIPDLIATTADSAIVLQNTAPGFLRSAYRIRGGPRFASADSDGDGDVDFVCGGSQMLSLLANRGDGTLGVSLHGGTDVDIVAVPLDVGAAFVYATASGLHAMRLRSTGGPQRIDTPGGSAQPLELVDIDGDARLDVVGTHPDATTVLRQIGGWFTAMHVPVGSSAPVVVTDLDSDAHTDFLLSTPVAFTPLFAIDAGAPFRVGPTYAGVLDRAEDLSGDTNVDAVADQMVLEGVGDGDLVAPLWSGLVRSVDGTGEFDGDGHGDVVTYPAQLVGFAIVFGAGDGMFARERDFWWNDEPGSGTRDVAVADLDGNGSSDLAFARTDRATVFLNQGATLFGPSATYATGIAPTAIVTGDFDGDTDADLVLNGWATTILFLRNRGDGTFDAPTFHEASAPEKLVAGDFDADDKLDVGARIDGGVAVLFGRGDGTFDAPVITANSSGSKGMPLAAADLNDDGRTDMAVAGFQVIEVLLADEQRRFRAPLSWPSPSPEALAIADIDLDGAPDVLDASTTDSNAGVRLGALLGPGLATASQLEWPPIARTHASLLIADFDHDGRSDVMLPHVFLRNRTQQPTPVRVSDFTATWVSDGVQLRWTLSDAAGAHIHIERAQGQGDEFVELTPQGVVSAPVMEYLDRSAPRGLGLRYRLGETSTDGSRSILAMLDLDPEEAAVATALLNVRVHRSALEVHYRLADAGLPLQFTLFDVRGRRIATMLPEANAAGTHVTLMPLGRSPQRPAGGVYFFEFHAGRVRATRKLLLLATGGRSF